jgi:multicomponent Na+:H+ antiporter subunit B
MAAGWLMRLAGFVLVALLGAALVWGATGLPQRGDPLAPAAVHELVAVYYIERSYEETRTPNMVTAVLVDYRGFDTFGEALVVVVAALSCLLILPRRQSGPREGRSEEDRPKGVAR